MMIWLSVIVVSVALVAVVWLSLGLRSLRAARNVEALVSQLRKEQRDLQCRMKVHMEVIEKDVDAVGWQVMYMFVPESCDYDYPDYILERLRAIEGFRKRALDYVYGREPGQDPPILGFDRAATGDLRERTNALQLLKPMLRVGSPDEASAGAEQPAAVGEGA